MYVQNRHTQFNLLHMLLLLVVASALLLLQVLRLVLYAGTLVEDVLLIGFSLNFPNPASV
jgi:competence protein ComGC